MGIRSSEDLFLDLLEHIQESLKWPINSRIKKTLKIKGTTMNNTLSSHDSNAEFETNQIPNRETWLKS